MHRFASLILLGAVMVVAAVYALRTTPSSSPGPIEANKGIASQQTAQTRTETGTGSAPETRNPSGTGPIPAGKGFDFYVLSLSWSPSFCLSEAGSGNRQQCGDDASYGLVVHGLWPQNEKGYPENCTSTEPERVPDRLGRTLFDIMPGMGLIGHQWRKHGTCSGLSQADYFRVTRAAYEKVAVPAQLRAVAEPDKLKVSDVERLFTSANPGLTPQSVAVTCDDGRLDEVRICLSKELSFRDCAEVDRQSCRLPFITIPPIR